MEAAKAVLEAPEGDVALEAAIRGLLGSAPQENGNDGDRDGASQIVPAARIGELASALLQGCEDWEAELFRALVTLCRVEQLGADQVRSDQAHPGGEPCDRNGAPLPQDLQRLQLRKSEV